ncbi:Esf2p [Sugiyamaella lignohabitans]|uniref:Pre-rRNA-processing protein ESF2 n=1 Tax=Sugiyamaella lignohabitans TaxID=796027 RepID=A0A167DSR9_9ASCO|nr:Esf2p [Sugiyamaella lignohabitans]ANB13250.1 Esf2p [Sugiyamaella lignohabitans]
MVRSKATDFFNVEQSGSDADRSDSEDGQNFNSQENNDIYGSDNEDVDDEEEEFKGRSSISNKRRREDAFKSDNEDDEDEDESIENQLEEDGEEEYSDRELEEDFEVEDKKAQNGKLKPLTKEQVEQDLEKIRKSGVVYISRIPPYMKPQKLRQILSRFGEVNRIFLTPEDPKVYAKRVKYGGNKKKNYTEGWAEFVKKKNAKLAADTLNGNIIGGKKGSYYHDDILNVKYLSKFKWQNLTEQIALEAQSRQEKLRAEIAQATRENKIFIENVERHKMIQGIQKKRAEKAESSGGAKEPAEIRRTFQQRQVESRRSDATKKSNDKNLDKTVSRVLSKVF